MGADLIEFHFTDSKEGKSFRDHMVSFTPEDVQELIKKIKRINLLKGSSIKRPTASEINSDHINSFRRGIYPSKDLEAGTILTEKKSCCFTSKCWN